MSEGETPRDLREFIEVLQRTEDATVVEQEVHWDLELGAIGRRACELDGPAILFPRIVDYPNFSILVNPIATWRRTAVALGLRPDTPISDLYQEYMKREANLIDPRTVHDAPCKENILTGKDVDLHALPAPMIHEGDGGRYLGTWCIVVSRDPETGWVNWGTYRFMVHKDQFLTGWPLPTSHFGKVLQEKYVPHNRPMPVAIAIGADLASHLAATSTYRLGCEESALAGGLAGRPVELIECETSDLLVPATAEIVLEGEILPDRIAHEGPYGEYPGYRSGEMGRGVLCRVQAITYRNDPILTVDCTGLKDCTSVVTALGGGIAVQRRLERQGIPVTAVYVPPEGATHLAIVAVKKGGKDVAQQVLNALTARRAYLSKIVVVDEDVNVFNLTEVIHAFSTKCHPGRGILLTTYEGRAQTLTPYYDQQERSRRAGATAAFDATWPPHWDLSDTPVKATFEGTYPEEIKQKVLDNWRAYGL